MWSMQTIQNMSGWQAAHASLQQLVELALGVVDHLRAEVDQHQPRSPRRELRVAIDEVAGRSQQLLRASALQVDVQRLRAEQLHHARVLLAVGRPRAPRARALRRRRASRASGTSRLRTSPSRRSTAAAARRRAARTSSQSPKASSTSPASSEPQMRKIRLSSSRAGREIDRERATISSASARRSVRLAGVHVAHDVRDRTSTSNSSCCGPLLASARAMASASFARCSPRRRDPGPENVRACARQAVSCARRGDGASGRPSSAPESAVVRRSPAVTP